MIDGKTLFGGIIGRNIGFTLSPLIHNTAARDLGLNAIYLTFDMSSVSPAFFSAMHAAENCYGFSITVPYKEQVAKALSTSASCNTVSRLRDGWKADSTDGPGFIEGLREIDRSPNDFQDVIILGNGGAAKAVVASLLDRNPGLHVSVLRRSISRDGEWVPDSRVSFHPFQKQKLAELILLHPKALLIQSTSAPLKGDSLESFVSTLKPFQGTFVDLVYGRPSDLYSVCKEKGLAAQDGLPMLLHQALLAQEIWWGRSANIQVLREALKDHIKA